MQLAEVSVFAIIALFGNVICLPRDCQDIYDLGFSKTAKYVIYPDNTNGFAVRCDMDPTSGGWTVIQRRDSDSDFYLGWSDYQSGFGDFASNFWLGLLQIHKITSQSWYTLRVDMTHENGTTAFATYKVFAVDGPDSKYRVLVSGYAGDAGDSFSGTNGFQFTTKDQDNDIYPTNCAVDYVGAWWYSNCHSSNLNGDYGNTEYAKGLTWRSFTGYYSSLTAVEMKVKPYVPDYTDVGVPL